MARQPAATPTADQDVANQNIAEQDTLSAAPAEHHAEPFVGRWNRLVSTTNWEKGRIICEWREALIENGAAVTDYSDEAWTQLVGGVTSQHVGRLRRVFQRFGEVFDQYQGLFWSHFQAAVDWDDAEMWLEGAIRNEWSVSQMRGSRWETLGTPPSEQVAELAAAEEGFPAASAAATELADSSSVVTPQTASISDFDETAAKSEQNSAESDFPPQQPTSPNSTSTSESTVAAKPKTKRLKVNVEALPDDVADAFEQFKLAIIAHRREGWQETTQESILECLDALRELVESE